MSRAARRKPKEEWQNRSVALRLREVAELLEAEGDDANVFPAAAYRRAADAVEALDRDVADMVAEDGRYTLSNVAHIGMSIATAIEHMVTEGRWGYLEKLRAKVDAEAILRTAHGIGPELAHRIHEELGVEDLDALEAAARDGSIAKVPGVGPRRARAIEDRILELRPPRRRTRAQDDVPSTEDLLAVDREYRRRQADLPKIAPRRFNPEHDRWLPILRTERNGWQYTALFSNTAQAHKLGKTHDWVVIYFKRPGHPEQQRTIVTEPRGPHEGHRTIRGG